MIELKSTTTYAEELGTRKVRPLPKQWQIAERKSACESHNSGLETSFHMIVGKAKSLYSTLPDEYARMFIERDYKKDTRQGYAFHMNEFYNASFRIVLYCSLDLRYRISYDIQYSPFQQQLEDFIQKQAIYYPNTLSQQRSLSIEELFKKRLFSEDKNYIDTLEYQRTL